MNIKPAIIAALTGLMPVASNAFSLDLPAGAALTSKSMEQIGSTVIPIAAFSQGQVPVISTEGAISTSTWKFPSENLSTFLVLASLRDQLEAAGFETILDCNTNECGGFDFRFEISLVSEPDMHVDLGDFRFLSARKDHPSGQDDFVTLVVSRGGDSAFVQIIQVGKPDESASVIVASSKSTTNQNFEPVQMPESSLATMLETIGRAPLEDLTFETGSSTLGKDSFGSLAELAAYLKTNPDKSVALVGHTDAQGSLANNMALSKKRAASVLKRLASAYDIPTQQLEAAGVGYLVPRASNITPEGRTQNRRVEVILTSTR